MIFATVGTQLPFDRLLLGLDSWAMRNPATPVLAQTGTTQRAFPHIKTVTHLSQTEFYARIKAAQLIVAHAGMGSILSAVELGKPIILMPRRAKFHEHRNDHQQDTASEMERLSTVSVAQDGEALHEALDRAVARGFEPPTVCAPSQDTLDPLIETVRDFVWSGRQGTTSHRSDLGRDAA